MRISFLKSIKCDNSALFVRKFMVTNFQMRQRKFLNLETEFPKYRKLNPNQEKIFANQGRVSDGGYDELYMLILRLLPSTQIPKLRRH